MANQVHLAMELTLYATQLNAVWRASSILNRRKEPVNSGRGRSLGTGQQGLRSQLLLSPPHQGKRLLAAAGYTVIGQVLPSNKVLSESQEM